MKPLTASILFLFFLSLNPVLAETIIPGGNVSGTWEASGSPYLVEGEITIPSSDTLVIEPGVDIIFQGHYKLIVYGWLLAEGTENDSILFTAADTSEGWHGIRFIDAQDSSYLLFCIIQYGQAWGSEPDDNGGAVYCEEADPVFQHCIIRNSSASSGGGFFLAYSSAAIIHCSIQCNTAGNEGGGISCYYSEPLISNCIVSDNYAHWNSGIYGMFSVMNIEDCTIIGNTADHDAGGISFGTSTGIISNCIISGNATEGNGGGIRVGGHGLPIEITDCVITENESWMGGGICLYYANNTIITDCFISNNVTYIAGGGGISCHQSINPKIKYCTITENISALTGGGIECGFTDADISHCTITRNWAFDGGGVYNSGGITSSITDCIIWENALNEIYPQSGSSSPDVTYCDIMGGWPGMGNINQDPAFVDTTWDDYRLQWGSPCIDTGNPDPLYNDPDGTRSDMGAYYYDQSIPIRILMTPHNTPLEIPPEGGSFDYTIQATNIDPLSLNVDAWCDVTLPSGGTYGPTLGPVNIDIPSEFTISRERTQAVPAGAPAGNYTYNGYAIAGTDTSEDSFAFTKLGSDGVDELAGWYNSGESFSHNEHGGGTTLALQSRFALLGAFPNPFNAQAALRFSLREASQVDLTVFDVRGRKVAKLVNGYRIAGDHDVTFEAAAQPSGVYFVRLTVGDFSQTRKILLIK